MKSTQLLSVVLSLILIFGVSAGSAQAETYDGHDLDELVNIYCELDNKEQQLIFFSDNEPLWIVEDSLANYCEMSESDREEILEEYDTETRDYDHKNDRHDDLEDILEDFCDMTDAEKNTFFDGNPRIIQFEDRLTDYCELYEDERDNAIENFIKEYVPEARGYDFGYVLNRYCEMSDEQKQTFTLIHDKSEDHIAKVNAYCQLDEDERDAYIEQYEDEFRIQHDRDMQDKLERYCEMSDLDKKEFLAEHNKTAEHAEKMNKYCGLDEDGQINFIKEHRGEYMSQMKDKLSDYKREHMMLIDEMKSKHKQARDHIDYSKYCELSEDQRVLKIDDPEKLERIYDWCNLSPEERKDFKEKHHDAVKTLKEKHDLSPRLKEMIMDKYDIAEERMDEIKVKYKEKYGDLTGKQRSELEMKFKDYMSSIKSKISDKYKSAIHDRVAEMKEFKEDLRAKVSDMTDDEKQQLREEFIQKAKDMQLAWISPRTQITVGIDVADVECREGFNLVMKASNGMPMCLKADTAFKMIDRGLVVPAN